MQDRLRGSDSIYDASKIPKEIPPDKIVEEIEEHMNNIVDQIQECSSRTLFVLGTKADSLLTKYRRKLKECGFQRVVLRLDRDTKEWIYPKVNVNEPLILFLDSSHTGFELKLALRHLKASNLEIHSMYSLIMNQDMIDWIVKKRSLRRPQIECGYPPMTESECDITGERLLLYCKSLDDSHRFEIPYILYEFDQSADYRSIVKTLSESASSTLGDGAITTQYDQQPLSKRIWGRMTSTTNCMSLPDIRFHSQPFEKEPDAITVCIRVNEIESTLSLSVETHRDSTEDEDETKKKDILESRPSELAAIVDESNDIVAYSKTGPETRISDGFLSSLKEDLERNLEKNGISHVIKRFRRTLETDEN